MPRLPLPLLAPLLLAPLLMATSACTPAATTSRPATAPAPTPAPQTPAPDPSPADTPQPRPLGTEDVLGKSPEAVTQLLGPASLDRTEGAARHLQFGGGPCILDVYFYPGDNGTPAAATFAEARMFDGRDADASACINRRVRDRELEDTNPPAV